jgi:hypothetical protein
MFNMKNVKKFQDKLWKSALRWTDFELTFISYFLHAVSHEESLQKFDTKPALASPESIPGLHLKNKHSCPHSIQLLKYVYFLYTRVHWVGLFWKKWRLLTR